MFSTSKFLQQMKSWKRKHPEKLQKQIEDLWRQLDASSHDDISQHNIDLQNKLDVAIYHNEIYWQQCSRIDWLQVGDRNSKIFHKKASYHYQKYFIKALQNS